MDGASDEIARTRTRLAALILLGFVVRVICLSFVRSNNSDTDTFVRLAHGLLSGHGFTTENAPPFAPSFERPPIYPLFIAAVEAMFGQARDFPVLVAQELVDLCAVGLVFYATRRRFGTRAALVAAGLYAMLPFGSGMAAQIYSESLAAAFVALALASYEKGRGSERPSPWMFLSGIAWGCASLARPYLAPLAAVATLGAYFEMPSRRLRNAIILSLGVCAAVAPWAIRNAYWSQHSGKPFAIYQPLGSRRPYTDMYTDGFLYWMRSYEEPFLWGEVTRPPDGPYVDAKERADVAALFARMNANGNVIDDNLDRDFRRVADERREKAPFRCYVWRRVSSALKFWLAPHLSAVSVTIIHASGNRTSPRYLTLLCLLCSFGITALAAIACLLRRTTAVYLPASLAIFTTVVLVEVGLNESRYLLAILPLICELAGRGACAVSEFFEVRRS